MGAAADKLWWTDFADDPTRPWQVGHVHLVEPLSVAAFISAIQDWKKRAGSGRGFVLDIGMNVGFYTWLASAMWRLGSLVSLAWTCSPRAWRLPSAACGCSITRPSMPRRLPSTSIGFSCCADTSATAVTKPHCTCRPTISAA